VYAKKANIGIVMQTDIIIFIHNVKVLIKKRNASPKVTAIPIISPRIIQIK